jgi:hypothetical protein
MPNIIKQDGSPVDDHPEQPDDVETLTEATDHFVDAAKELNEEFTKGLKSVKKFRDGFLFKVGLIAVAIKAIDVVGKIIIEDRRTKAEERRQQDEK